MRLADTLFRHGHLSERALADAILTGQRPVHLDRCDLCVERAAGLGRSLDLVRDAAIDVADEAFPAERLSAQHAQIMRRLEQLDEPTRVIAFPRQTRLEARPDMRRLVARGWIGVAAAAGLVVGIIGGQATARVHGPAVTTSATQETTTSVTPATPDRQVLVPMNSSMLDMDLDAFTPESLGAMNDITPRKVGWQVARN